jgi:hypothetical protein
MSTFKVPSGVGSCPSPQILGETGKVCQGQTLCLICSDEEEKHVLKNLYLATFFIVTDAEYE